MSELNIISTIRELQEMENLLEDCKTQVEFLRDQLKAEMISRDTEELQAGQFTVRFATVKSNRFDSKQFQKDFGKDAYLQYCKEITSRRFSIA